MECELKADCQLSLLMNPMTDKTAAYKTDRTWTKLAHWELNKHSLVTLVRHQTHLPRHGLTSKLTDCYCFRVHVYIHTLARTHAHHKYHHI